MAAPIEFFACWTAHFSVELVPPTSPASPLRLRFEPVRKKDGVLRRDLFQDWFKTSRNGQPLPTMLNLMAALTPYQPRAVDNAQMHDALLTAARHFGPLFTLLPGQTASEVTQVEEPAELWLKAARMLRQLSDEIARMTKASKDGSKTARKRRMKRDAEADIGNYLHSMPDEMRRQHMEPYRPSPGISEYDVVAQDVSNLIDAMWLLPLRQQDDGLRHLTIPRPRLSEPEHAFQLNMPFGIQALLIMTLHDQSIGRTLVMRSCARSRCRKVMFMKPRQQFCSEECQRAAAAQRVRDKKNKKRKKPDAPTSSNLHQIGDTPNIGA